MGVHRELRLEVVAGHEILIGRDGKRRWPEELKGQLVAETQAAVEAFLIKQDYGLGPACRLRDAYKSTLIVNVGFRESAWRRSELK